MWRQRGAAAEDFGGATDYFSDGGKSLSAVLAAWYMLCCKYGLGVGSILLGLKR